MNKQTNMQARLYLFIAALLAAGGMACIGAGSEDDSPIGITLKPVKGEFEVGESAGFDFGITNLTSQAVTLPSFHFVNIMMEDANVIFYVREGMLKISVWQGTNKVPMNTNWLNLPVQNEPYPTVILKPTDTIHQTFTITGGLVPNRFFTLTNPGLYTVSITMDTTTCKDNKIPKGVFVSPGAKFRIVSLPIFRAKRSDESPEIYAQAKVTFYLKRISQNTGEYFYNVSEIARSNEAVAALTELLGSPDKEVAGQSSVLLAQFYEPLDGRTNHPPLPKAVEEWRTWAKETGSRLTPGQLFGNFDSHFQ